MTTSFFHPFINLQNSRRVSCRTTRLSYAQTSLWDIGPHTYGVPLWDRGPPTWNLEPHIHQQMYYDQRHRVLRAGTGAVMAEIKHRQSVSMPLAENRVKMYTNPLLKIKYMVIKWFTNWSKPWKLIVWTSITMATYIYIPKFYWFKTTFRICTFSTHHIFIFVRA